MINFILFNVTLLLAGYLALFIFSIGLMICLSPMALFLRSEKPSKILIFPMLAIAALYQIYFWGFWSSFCVAMTIKFVQKPEVTWDWLYWITGFMGCTALIAWLTHKEKQSSTSFEEGREIQRGSTLYSVVAVIAFLIFAYAPSLMLTPYGWSLNMLGLYKQISPNNACLSEIKEYERNHPQIFGTEKTNCKTAIISFIEAHLMMSDEQGNIVQLSKREQDRMESLIQKGLTASMKVSGNFLKSVHSELPSEFRNHLIAGWQLYLSGLETSDPLKQIKGIQLVQQWEDFRSHNLDLLYKSIIE